MNLLTRLYLVLVLALGAAIIAARPEPPRHPAIGLSLPPPAAACALPDPPACAAAPAEAPLSRMPAF